MGSVGNNENIHEPNDIEAEHNGVEVNEVEDNYEIENEESAYLEISSKSTHVGNSKMPQVGMLFCSMEDALNFYEDFGRENGFSVRKRSTYRTRRGPEITSAVFTCSCEGLHRKKCDSDDEGKIKRSSSTIREGCKACMRVTKQKNGDKWMVKSFLDKHNHAMVTPSKRIHMRTNRRMSTAAKNLTESFDLHNLQVGKVVSVFGGSSWNVGFDQRDCWNHLRSVRANRLEVGDAQAVLNYFRKKQCENPNFYYAIQCDKHDRATNFFWIDARSRMAYSHFGDVITFDTTYKTNKYNMPFAPFTGVNHHHQSILFGCALLQDEVEETFVWLFESWLDAMGHKHPISIITDQDLAISGAVAKVFPNTRHRYCLWHIKQKFVARLANVYFKRSRFKRAVKKCIRFTYTIKDFEEQWAALMLEFGLTENQWLKRLYNIRHSWIPVFNRGTFFAGMNTTQRSESINFFFDGFVDNRTSLIDFVVKYDQALEKIGMREQKEDYDSVYKTRVLATKDLLLTHAGTIYTKKMFEKFKLEYDEMCQFIVNEEHIEGDYHMYMVRSRGGIVEEFLVKINLATREGSCGCQNYEFVGIPCRHIIRVFDRLYISEIPPHFIRKRWTKIANRDNVVASDELLIQDSHFGTEAIRSSHLCRESLKVAYLAGRSKETYRDFLDNLAQLSKKYSLINDDMLQQQKNGEPSIKTVEVNDAVLLNPHISRTKGRKKVEKDTVKEVKNSDRWKCGMEKSIAKKKPRKCRICYKHGHDTRNCKKNPKNKEMQGLNEEVTELTSDPEDVGQSKN